MYVQHFGLEHEPFSIAPDPRYLYLGERHREALAHLLYGLAGGGGFVLLTGEVGAGKTTVCRGFLEQVPPHCQVAYVFNPKLTVTELLAVVCEEFGIELPAASPGQAAPTVKQYVDPLNRFLLASHADGRNAVLVIDEAQQLAPDVLEQLRLLTNLETSERKLLQIVLVGQPELRDLLMQPGLEQLAQRVIARYHLGPLDAADTGHYVQHRLAVAGLRGPSPIPATLMPRVHRLTGGVPRRINLLCDRALLGAFSQGKATVDARTLAQAAREVSGESGAGWPGLHGRVPRWAGPAAAFALGGLVVAAWVGAGGGTVPAPADRRAAQGASSTASPASATASGSPLPTATLGPDELARRLRSPRLDEAQAWRLLAGRWGVPLAAGEPCAAAQRQQLACFRSRGGLAELRGLDRPAILVLRDTAGATLHVLLVGLDRERAWLQLGEVQGAVTLADLAGWWRGEFATLWRTAPPAGDAAPDTPGDDEAALLRRLAAAPGAPASGSGADASLQARLTAFQLTQGLVPDGRPGPLTLMALNRATGVAEPRLDPRP